MIIKYQIDDVLYLRTDPERIPRLCTGYTVRRADISYELASGTTSSWHYQNEVTNDPDESIFRVKKIGINDR